MSENETPKSVSVHELIMVATDQIASVAWSKLGLHPDPISGQISTDLEEAKVAIDVVAYLASVLEPKLSPEDKREMQNLVSNLRLNFVEKSRNAN